MKDVAGKTAFVTGGASGIGLGMAKVFARAGMNVVAADIRDDHLEHARGEIDVAGLSKQVRFLKLAILRALGEDKVREDTALELIPGLVGSPIYREAP